MGGEWHHGSVSIGLLAVLISFTTLSLQFTSTALLSQVGIALLPVPIFFPQTYYGTDPDGITFRSQLGGVHSYLDVTPKGYPAFAEWVSNVTVSDMAAQHGEFAPNSAPGLRDTGTVVRAFLPVNNTDERNRVTEYQGFGTAVDMRVVCMRPTLTDVKFSTRSGYRVTGLADTEQKPSGLLYSLDAQGSRDFSVSFDCGFAAAAVKNYSESNGWPLSLCSPVQYHSKKGIYSVMEAEGKEALGRSILLINATTIESVTDLDGSDLWESLSIKANDSNSTYVSLQFTLCMTAFEAQEMVIHATRAPSIPPEPVLTWNTSTATYITEVVLRQLGAGKRSAPITERGIFDLAPRLWQFPERPEFLSLTGGTFSTTSALDRVNGDIYSGTINNAQYSVLAQMAESTADPALAIQAFFTTLFAMTYYDRNIMFDVAAPSLQVSLVQVIQPLGWTAYIIVVVVAVSHLLLVLLTTIIFYSAGKLSRMGNAWTAISQILGPTTEDWIRNADMVDDKTVKAWLKARGLNKTLVRIENVEGRVQLVRKNKVS